MDKDPKDKTLDNKLEMRNDACKKFMIFPKNLKNIFFANIWNTNYYFIESWERLQHWSVAPTIANDKEKLNNPKHPHRMKNQMLHVA
jgi:hypothetical protein